MSLRGNYEGTFYHDGAAQHSRFKKRRYRGNWVGTRCIFCGMVGSYDEIDQHHKPYHWCFQMEKRVGTGTTLAGFGGAL